METLSLTKQAIRSLADVIHLLPSLEEEVRQYDRILKLPNGMSNLRKEFESLQGFIGDAQERQEHDEDVRKWMSEIKDLAYEAQDITEKNLNQIKRHMRIQRGCCFNALRILNYAMVLEREVSKIYASTQKVSRVTTNMKAYGIECRPVESTSAGEDTSSYNLTPYVDEDVSIIVGFDEDIKTIENQLMCAPIKVIGICGTNGLGKTTLAREVLKRSTLVKERFDAIAWAFLGQEFQVGDVLKNILSDLIGNVDDEEWKNIAQVHPTHEDMLSEIISQILKEKTCLVVLDDFQTPDTWSTTLESAFSTIFQSTDSSSKLVLTTCDAGVLSIVHGQGYLHQPKCLASEERWELFLNKTSSLG